MLEAAHLRFRPIVMTSMAFILGVLPLVLASGAGSASQHSIGTGVLGGMLSATALAVFFVPVFFVVVRSIFRGSERQRQFDPRTARHRRRRAAAEGDDDDGPPRLTALAAAALLAGCMNLAPRYERPAAPVARTSRSRRRRRRAHRPRPNSTGRPSSATNG